MNRVVAKKFEEVIRDVKLVLVSNKKNSLIDFTSILPEMVTHAGTKFNILKDFLSAGFIGDKYKRYPDFNKNNCNLPTQPIQRRIQPLPQKLPRLI